MQLTQPWPEQDCNRVGSGQITTYYCQLGNFRENNNNESKLALEERNSRFIDFISPHS